jgi:hypothetical protein
MPNQAISPAPANPGSSLQTTGSHVQTQQQDQEFVFLGVTAGDDIRLAQLEVQRHGDAEFFHELKLRYAELRGKF